LNASLKFNIFLGTFFYDISAFLATVIVETRTGKASLKFNIFSGEFSLR